MIMFLSPAVEIFSAVAVEKQAEHLACHSRGPLHAPARSFLDVAFFQRDAQKVFVHFSVSHSLFVLLCVGFVMGLEVDKLCGLEAVMAAQRLAKSGHEV